MNEKRISVSQEVLEKPVCRRLTLEDKARILEEADACTEPGQQSGNSIDRQSFLIVVCFALLASAVSLHVTACHARTFLTGVNLAGAEFGESELPGIYETDYIYPFESEVDYFINKGMNVFRLPIRWERLQPTMNGSLDVDELARLTRFVGHAVSQGASVIIDPHNFARYYPSGDGNFQESTLGRLGNDIPDTAFADFWAKVADEFEDNDNVIFNLMCEPTAIDSDDWVSAANAAIAAIRNEGADNLIMVPGNRWTGAWTWEDSGGFVNGISMGRSNADALLDIVDPENNFAIEVHQYMDSNGSGTSDQIHNDDPMIGVDRVEDCTQWLIDNNLRGFLGEFAVGNDRMDDIGDDVVNNLLVHLEENGDVWLGWAWWAAGPWWAGGPGQNPGQNPYLFLLDPENLDQGNETDKPAMAILQPHFQFEVSDALNLADFNGDGEVDTVDLAQWEGDFGINGDSDADADGDSDGSDFLIWQQAYGNNSNLVATNVTVPEPASWMLVIVGIPLMVSVITRTRERLRFPEDRW